MNQMVNTKNKNSSLWPMAADKKYPRPFIYEPTMQLSPRPRMSRSAGSRCHTIVFRDLCFEAILTPQTETFMRLLIAENGLAFA